MQLSSHDYTTAASFPMVQEQREKSVKIPLEALQMQHVTNKFSKHFNRRQNFETSTGQSDNPHIPKREV